MKNSKWLTGYILLSLTVFFVVWTGLIPKWGTWYSEHLAYRSQVDSFLAGQVAIGHDPANLDWDLAWAGQSVQQIWGLGVPALRLPFEIAARIFGLPGFPDRLVLIFLFVATLAAVLRFQSALCPVPNGGLLRMLWQNIGLFPTVLCPPLLALCSTRFLVYEEVIAYGFLLAILLLVWTAHLSSHPRPASFLGLALASGLIAFVRPTFGVYGLASLIAGCVIYWRNGRQIRLILLACLLFGAGILLLMASNRLRFGHGLEFGHSLTVNGIHPMMYATRFDNPFSSEPVLSAMRELLSLLFHTRSVTALDAYAYAPDLFAGQSPTFRYRELYFSLYDPITLLVALGVWICLAWRTVRLSTRLKSDDRTGPFEIVALWSLVAAIPLALFYLRFPFISSRYLMDFAPAFSAAWWVATYVILNRVASRFSANRAQWACIAFVAGWWCVGVATTKVVKVPHSCTWKDIVTLEKEVADRPSQATLPASYTNGYSFSETGIRFNGSGWNSENERSRACVTLFVNDPECLTIVAEPVANQSADLNCIQARIGLEILERKSAETLPEGVRITFYGPKEERYRSGFQLVSLAMVCAENLSNGRSGFQIREIEWRLKDGLARRKD